MHQAHFVSLKFGVFFRKSIFDGIDVGTFDDMKDGEDIIPSHIIINSLNDDGIEDK